MKRHNIIYNTTAAMIVQHDYIGKLFVMQLPIAKIFVMQLPIAKLFVMQLPILMEWEMCWGL